MRSHFFVSYSENNTVLLFDYSYFNSLMTMRTALHSESIILVVEAFPVELQSVQCCDFYAMGYLSWCTMARSSDAFPYYRVPSTTILVQVPSDLWALLHSKTTDHVGKWETRNKWREQDHSFTLYTTCSKPLLPVARLASNSLYHLCQ